jgi:hypothetical protein
MDSFLKAALKIEAFHSANNNFITVNSNKVLN